MSKTTPWCLGALLFLGMAASGYGQVNTSEGATVNGHGRVNAVNAEQNKVNSDLANAKASGQLSTQEAEDLKRKQNQIQAEKTQDMMKHHGHLTKGEKKELKKEEKQLDKQIKKEATPADGATGH